MTWLNELPYTPDSSRLFEIIADRPWAMFLDSGHPHTSGRWDILTADPSATFVTRGPVTELCCQNGLNISEEDPFALLRKALGTPVAPIEELPFAGGMLGWFSYDLARRIERLPLIAADVESLPDMAVGLFDWAVLVDHQTQRTWLASHSRDPKFKTVWPRLLRLWREPTESLMHRPFRVLNAPRSNLSYTQYAASFARIHNYIRNGDCYQVNFAQRFAAPVEGNSWTAYKVLRDLNPAPYAAYLNTPYGQILSSSPERFLTVRNGAVETQPIKGTRARGKTLAEDWALARELAESAKDRAENLMIVDLLRNDLGKVCVPGSILVPQLFKLERFATVQHLISTVTGQLAPEQDAVALLHACFPGGSVTGAPKIRAMQIIEELEPQRRGVYCGSIGYLGLDGAMDTNIAIRTLAHNNGCIRFWAGGGIVYDSVLDQEYQETLHKAEAMLQLLHSFPAVSR